MSRIQWANPGYFWLAMLLLAAVLTAIVWLYRPQVSPLRTRWWWMLPGLRGLALAMLAVSLLRPQILSPVSGADRGAVAILVDQSQSMSAVDTERTPAQLVQIADALGELPDGVRPAQLTDLRQRVSDLLPPARQLSRARIELEYARLSGREIDSAGAHLRETRTALAAAVKSTAAAAPGALADPISRVAGETAIDQIDRIIERIDTDQTSADEQLYQSNEQVRDVCDELGTLPRIELVRLALGREAGILQQIARRQPTRVFGFDQSLTPLADAADALDASGTRTDIVAVLRQLRQRLPQQQIGAVVVLSDGHEVGSSSGGTSLGNLPVVAVNIAAARLKDLAISQISLPSSAFVDETISIRVDLRADGFDGQAAEVILQGPDQRQTDKVTIDRGAARADFSLAIHRPGPQELTITVAPMPGEASGKNNTQRRVVKVISERIGVGLLAGVGTRDFQELRLALADAPGISVTDQIIDELRASLTEQQILDLDVLVLCDVAVRSLDSRQWDAVVRLVSERGGSVLVMGGDPSVIGAYALNPLTASLVPWRGDALPAWRTWPGETPVFRIAPADDDAMNTLRLSSDSDLSRARWNQLPPVFRFMSLPPLKAGVRPILVESESGLPVLTDMRLGAGHALFLGMNEAWRWRSALESNRIWRQIIRSAAREPYAVTDGDLALDADRLRIEPGEPLRVRARRRGGAAPVLEVIQGSKLIGTPSLTALAGSPGEYQVTLEDLSAGRYTLQLTADQRAIPLPLTVAVNAEAELRDLSGDRNELRRLAGSLGEVMELRDLKSLPQTLIRLQANEPRFTEVRLWDSPYLFLFVLGCLGLEWAVRKHVGLA